MVLEETLVKLGKRKIYSFLLGFIYVFIAFGTGKLFFPNDISIAMIFFITLLLVPSMARLISMEERIERRDGLHRFFRDHYSLIEIFFFLFIGILVGYLVIGTYEPESITHQRTYLEQQGLIGDFVQETTQPLMKLGSILYNNITVIIIAFILSLFYGVGAMFLIVLNASVFAEFILIFMQNIHANTINTLVLFGHTTHEVLGFLLAAMAGGVISKALMRERIGTQQFRNVVKDGTVLLVIAIVVIILAALAEVFLVPGIIVKPQ